MDDSDLDARFAAALHAGSAELAPNQPFTAPLTLASQYFVPGMPAGPHQYGRWSNPTWQALEDALALIEDAPVLILPSGMATVAAVYYALLKSGDAVLLPSDGYYVTRALAEKYLVPFGVRVDLVATRELATRDLTGYRVVWSETPSNPGLDLADIRDVAARAHAAGALVVVDNTTASPLGQRPLELGADLVVVADTKSVNGHSDVVFGHVATRDPALLERLRDWRKMSGTIPGPFEAWLVHRGLETFELRFERACTNAAALAPRLAAHGALFDVRYPGLPSHPQHDLARRQMRRFGSLIGITLASEAAAERFLGACRLVRQATSFGGVHSSAERRARWGDQVAPGFIRMSVGCEPLEPLWRDLSAALDRVAST
jgi:cystathionine gamma-lyase